MLKVSEQTLNVYENKEQYDTMTEIKSDFSARTYTKNTDFEETVGFFVTIRALRNDFLRLKMQNLESSWACAGLKVGAPFRGQR
jgi:hypothetical protein